MPKHSSLFLDLERSVLLIWRPTLKLAFILLAAAGIAFTGTASCLAQTNFLGGVHFNVGFPRGDLKDNIERNAYGVSGQFFYAPQQSPLGIGLEVGYMNYGNEDRREPFSQTIPDVTVNVETSNNIVQSYLVLRVKNPGGSIQLYGDAVVGLNYLFTETKISDSSHQDEEIASSVNWDDTALAYGFGGGIMIQVHNGESEDGNPFHVLVDAGVRFLRGDEAEYLKKGSIRRKDGAVTFDSLHSRTDMLKLHVGVVFRFGS